MSIVERALASPPDDLERYLEETCADDTQLMEQVRTYVAWERKMEGFLTEPMCRRAFFEHPFQPGQLLEQRFRIIREIAQGGMGIVYEAVDQKLNRRIAIKCSKPGFGKRLPPEVRNASDIGHPNICKIYEIHTTSTEHGLLDFMTMEFLDGETLTARLRRGFLTHKEALPIALQLCAGLAEAHRKHVIHGDLKSSNIVLTSDGGAVRAVLTDFGLAHRPDASLQSSRSPEVAGTPDYMAPELWNGAAVSVASDVYALGVILREMVCGQEPNARWNRVVKRCLCHDPEQRYATVDEIAHALAPASRRLFLTSAIAAGLALASGIATYKTTTGPTETVRLALLPLESDAAGISRGLAGQFSRLKGSARTRWSLAPFTQSDGQYSDPIGHARTALSATHVLQGSITPEKDSFSVQAYLIDTRTRARTGEFKAVYRSGEERYIPVALAGMVTATFGLPPMEGAGEMDPAARQHFQSGLIQLRRESRVDNGIASMQRAVAADPHSALTHAGQALAWWWKYFVANDDKYLSLSEQSLAEAQRRNGDLALVHHVAGLHFLNKDMHGEAVKEFLRTVELDPENCDGHRALAIAYEGAGEDDKAVSEYQRAIELDPQYHRNYQAFATYYYHRSEHEEAIKHFKKAVELAPQEPATHYALATGYIEIGEFSAAEAELRTALVLGETPRFLNNLAVALMYQRRDQEAIPYLTRALDSSPHRYRWWMNLGIAYQRRGLLQESRRAYEQGLAEAQAELMKNPRNVANMARGGSAYLRARLGDLQGSQSDIAQALSYAPKDQGIRWMALLTYEASGRREDSLDLLKSGPYAVLADASRWPELSDLAQDPRFQSLLLSKQQSEVHK